VPEEVVTMGGVPVVTYPAQGEEISDPTELVSAAFGARARWVAVPVERLPADFFILRTGVAGEFLQKLVNYQVGLAVVGDVTARLADSTPLADLVRESNRGHQCWFVADLADLESRLSRSSR
jgi:hypothetical protein